MKTELLGEGAKVGLSNDTSASVDRGLHLGDLRVYVLHELNNEIDQLVLVHRLSVEVGDEERDIVSLDGLTTQDDEGLRALGQEAHELLGQQLLQLIGLLNSNRDSQRVDGSLDQNSLLSSTSDDDRVQQEFGRGAFDENKQNARSVSLFGGQFLYLSVREFHHISRLDNRIFLIEM